jgi:kinetochore protein NDC80
MQPPRGSSITTSGRGADPRNIGDKQFMNTSIRILIDYLTQHEFNHAISPKILTRPAVKDFHNIVMFLFVQIDPNYKSTGKFEDEVVTMFKYLGYPYQISKSNLAAVGSPHAWPSLLASIMWLIELLSYDENVLAGELAEEEEDPDSLEGDASQSGKAFQSYLGTAYGLFMTGEDDRFAECEEGFIGSYEAMNTLIKDQTAELDVRSKCLSDEIISVEKRREYLPELQAKEKDYVKDLGKFQQLVEQLENHKEQLDTKVALKEQELQKLLSSIKSVNHEIDALRERVDSQELSPEDVKRMMAERDQLQQAQGQASENRQVLQRRVWESEMALRDRVQALEDSSRAYNGVAEDLKLVPSTARNARGRNLALEVDVRARKRDGLLKTDVRKDILPALHEMRADYMERTMSLRNECIAEKDAVEDSNIASNELQESRQMFESKLRRAEDAYKRERAVLDQASEMHAKEMEAMDMRLLCLRDTAMEESRVAAAVRRASEARLTRSVRHEDHLRRTKEITSAIMDVVTVCAEHRELVQQRLGDVREMHVQRLERMLTGDAAESVKLFTSMAAEEYSAKALVDSEQLGFGYSHVTQS